MAKSRKYPPELNEPIFIGPLYTILYGEDAAQEYLIKLRLAKLKKLMECYQIDEKGPQPFLNLAYKLACEHVKGFTYASVPPRRAGRPRSRDAMQKFELFKDVAALKEGGLTDSAACQFLAKKRSSQWHGKKWRTLANMFREVKKEIKGLESLTAEEKLARVWTPNEIEELKDNPPPEVHQKSRRE